MGDLRTKSIREIWYDGVFWNLRADLRKGIVELPICKKCMANPKEVR